MHLAPAPQTAVCRRPLSATTRAAARLFAPLRARTPLLRASGADKEANMSSGRADAQGAHDAAIKAAQKAEEAAATIRESAVPVRGAACARALAAKATESLGNVG